ncbi:putative flavin-containing monooxygenase 2 [Glycine soja]|uniref:putative flavin-containing monooxygenase 2 n=1 Tax=Glycine soja TaxID=3848 RepID=UPI00103A83F1|nr:putative flavin-containing monooxygenase 2 [Glycine soja]
MLYRYNMHSVSKIAIIGAGVSGIAASKQLSHHNPLVFEASDSIGGVWRHCSYNSTKLQSHRRDYEFSDFPWPQRESSEFPTHLEILDYLHSYAEHFDVLKNIRFNSKVVEIRYVGDQEDLSSSFGGLPSDHRTPLPGHPVWEIGVQKNNQSDSIQWYAFEFVVVCIGKYGDIPKIPEFACNKGPDVFKGRVMHTLDYCKLDQEAATKLLEGKKVVVVGFKKSGIDLAMECAKANQGPQGQSCTMVVRTPHWIVPHYRIWRSGISKFIESYLLRKLPLEKYELKPEHPFEEDYASCQMAIVPENFFSEADKGKIVFKRASNWSFWSGGIEFEDNSKLEADVVVLATGFDGKKKLKSILPRPFCSLLDYPSGLMPLYRGTIHPLIPNMAFVGYIESVSNLATSEIRSMWLSGLLDKKFELPSVEKMLSQTLHEMDVMKRSTRFYKRHCNSTHSINHNDEMCEDMGWSSWRKKNWITEGFSPYSSEDYRKKD